MVNQFSGKPSDSSTGEKISHSVILQRWSFLLRTLFSSCSKIHSAILYVSDWKILTWLGMSSEGLATLTEGARSSKHECTFISWRFAPMVCPTAVCFVASGEQIWGKPVDGSQASMSQHRRLHLSRCISGQQTRVHCPIMLRRESVASRFSTTLQTNASILHTFV